MNEEKMKILKMLEEKKISADEAMQLLEALRHLEGKEGRPVKSGGKFLKIRVHERGTPEAKVNISIPIAWSNLMAPLIEQKIGEKLKEKGYELDLDKLRVALEAGEPGKIVDVNDNGSVVEIAIE